MNLTPEQIAAVHDVAKRMKCSPESVLKHMIMSYAAKFGGKDPLSKQDMTNVVSIDAVKER